MQLCFFQELRRLLAESGVPVLSPCETLELTMAHHAHTDASKWMRAEFEVRKHVPYMRSKHNWYLHRKTTSTPLPIGLSMIDCGCGLCSKIGLSYEAFIYLFGRNIFDYLHSANKRSSADLWKFSDHGKICINTWFWWLILFIFAIKIFVIDIFSKTFLTC